MTTAAEKTLAAMAANQPKISNGTFTFSRNGEWRTFMIKTQSSEAKFAPNARILSLMTGRNNEKDFTGFAFVENDGIKKWKKRLSENEKLWKAYADLVWHVLAGTEQSETYIRLGYTVEASETCCRCNRKLTTPESIRYKIGPICAMGGTDKE